MTDDDEAVKRITDVILQGKAVTTAMIREGT
jgi:hypothetical protein